MTDIRDINHGHLFCGLGGGAEGFNDGEARIGAGASAMQARFVCKGGIDVDPAGCRDFERRAKAPAACLDLFDYDQYVDFHGRQPPPGWRAQTPQDIRDFFRSHLHILFLSAPCKGFSGLLPEAASRTAKYAALNRLTLRGVWLALEAYKDDPIEFILFENVPRIATRGRHLLDQIVALLRHYGYAVAETRHDCGDLGGLAQSRKRFLLVARHEKLVPPFLYEPVKRALRGVGEVLERFPVPGPEPILPMHRMPALQWKTWVRLAFVEAGSDWRSLNKLEIEDGWLRDFGIAPEREYHGGVYGVNGWGDTAPTVSGRGSPTCDGYSVADPRFDQSARWKDGQAYGVRDWDKPVGSVINVKSPGQGTYAVADPRVAGARFNNLFRIVRWAESSPAIAGPGGPAGGLAVQDPRAPGSFAGKGKYGIARFDGQAGTVIGAPTTGHGAFGIADPRFTNWHSGASSTKLHVNDWARAAYTVTGAQQVASGAGAVADPRPAAMRGDRPHYQTGGHYGVVDWSGPSYAVPGFAKYDRGNWSVADPRNPATCAETQTDPDAWLPKPDERLVAMIRALDGTWHRPFTTLELAALQGLVDAEEIIELDGQSDSAWRERIGNAVPPPAAKAIAGVMGRTLLLAWAGESFMLSAEPIWVRDVAVAVSVDQAGMP